MIGQLQARPIPVEWDRATVFRQDVASGSVSTSAGVLSQRIQIQSNLRPRRVEILASAIDPQCNVEFRTAANEGGDRIGNRSVTNYLSAIFAGSVPNWFRFIWGSAFPAPVLEPGDVWLTLIKVPLTNEIDWSFGSVAGGTRFQDATRCAYIGAVAQSDDDFAFRIFP